LLRRLEEEVKVNQFLATEKQPKEIAETKIYLEDLTRVASHPALTSTYLNQLNQKFCETQEEISQLIGKHMIENDPFDDKAMIFRQQAKIVADRKALTASTLAETRAKHLAVSKQLKNTKEKPTNDCEEMNHSQNESVVTMNISQISTAGDESQKAKNSEAHSAVLLEEVSALVQRLHHKIDLSRDKLSPLIKELHSLQEKVQELNRFHAEKQAQCDSISTDQDVQTLCLEQEARDLREEVQREETNYQNLNAALDNLKVQETRLHEELRGYITSTNHSDSTNEDSVKSITIKRHSHRYV
ncbi:unnamed protein product, partial [Rodentolepis nana]|uniref:GRIP domain-containing protein n=1 Tax=Rodentolepis nana TaxID=102285 RepID=A0A0R3TVY5_RODNA